MTVMLDCSGLPDRLVPYLDLFADFLTELGTAARDYKDFAQLEKATTGGVGASVSATSCVDGISAPEASRRETSFAPRCPPGQHA